MKKTTWSHVVSFFAISVALAAIVVATAGCEPSADQIERLREIRAATTQTAAQVASTVEDVAVVAADARTRADTLKRDADAATTQATASLEVAKAIAATQPSAQAEVDAAEAELAAAKAAQAAAKKAAEFAKSAEAKVAEAAAVVKRVNDGVQSLDAAIAAAEAGKDPTPQITGAINALPIPDTYKAVVLLGGTLIGGIIGGIIQKRKTDAARATADNLAEGLDAAQAKLEAVVHSVQVAFPDKTTDQKAALAASQGPEATRAVHEIKRRLAGV